MPESSGLPFSGEIQKQRRVIVFADLVESVRLMQDHEADAIDRWRRFAAQVREQLLPAQGGRLVRTAGDGLLIEFERPPPAVAAAFAMHQCLDSFNRGREVADAMLLRIGVHVADVLFDEHEAYGAGVNLAARLASLAQPGGTVVSAEARDELVDALHADIEDLGLRYVKHLTAPVRAFAVKPVGSPGQRGPQPPLPSADDLRPAVAVVPFSAMPADPAHAALGFAMADDVIAALSRHPGLRVLSRASTGALRDTALDMAGLQQMRQVLNASFLLTGRYYLLGTRVRLSAELCALPSGEVLWSGGAMAEIDALFAGQDDLVPHIVANVSQRVLAHELSRVRSLPMTTLASYTLFLGATGLMNSLVQTDFMRAREVLDHLVDRHPRQAAPYAMLAHWHIFRIVQGWTEDRGHESTLVQDQAQRAIDIDPQQTSALVAAGTARVFLDADHLAAQRYYKQALDHDPHDAHAWARLSEAQSMAADHVNALDSAVRAIALSPLDPRRYLFEAFAARAAFAGARYADAVRFAQASVRKHMLHAPSHRLLVAALWLDGRQDEARSAALQYRAAMPQAAVGVPTQPAAPGAGIGFTEALRLAGIPSHRDPPSPTGPAQR